LLDLCSCIEDISASALSAGMERGVGQKSRQNLDELTDRFGDRDNRSSDRSNRFGNAASSNSTSISQSF